MMMLRGSCVVVILTVWVVSSGAPAYAGPPPAWRFKAGETLRYRLTVKNEAEVKSSGVVDAVPKKSGLSLSLTLLWTVNRVAEDGTAALTQKIEHARLMMYHAYAERDEALYDSGDPATVNNQWSAGMDMAIRPLLHEPYFLKIDRHGRPIEVKRPESAVKAWKELGPVLEDKENPFAPLFTDNGFVALLAPVLPRPSHPSGVGDSWSYSWGDPQIPMQLTDTYAPTKSVGPLLKYLGKTKAVLTRATVPPTIPPPPISYPMTLTWGVEQVQFKNGRIDNQSGTATLTFDPVAGHLVEFTRDLTYLTAIDFQIGQDTPQSGTATGSYHLTAGLVLSPSQP